MNKKLLSSFLATTTFTSTFLAFLPQAVRATGASFVGACQQPETGNALVYYSYDGIRSSIQAEPNDNGKIHRNRVKDRLKNYRGMTGSEANAIKDAIPRTKISNMSLCDMGQFPFYRGNDNPTTFHSLTSEGNTGADIFQQFANTEQAALDLDALQARKLDATKLTLAYDNDVKVYFINEGAGYRNQLQVSTTGTTVQSGMVFNNISCHNSDPDCIGKWASPNSTDYALKAGDYADLGTLQAGTTLAFQVIANGFGNSRADVWHTDDSLNSDSLQHVIAYDYEGYLVLAWEDINGGGDLDYNDVVFAIHVGEDNLAEIPTDIASNTAPVTTDDSAVTPYETAVTINVLEGDSDPDGEAISLSEIASQPSNGSVTINGDSVVYTPNSGFSGEDTFEYTVADGQGATATGTVTVVVEPAPILACSPTSNITLTGTLRDFSDTHPDFERTNGVDGFRYGLDTGITTDDIGSDGKPVYADGSFSTTNRYNFNQWYRDIEGVNESQEYSITLEPTTNGKYRFSSNSFFPLDGELMGDQGRSHNYHFTYELHSQFTYNGGEVLNFSGDDDVWVYINGHKVIDIGGVHGSLDRSVSVDDIAAEAGLTIGGTYDFDFFFAERHTTQSNFTLETSIEMLCDYDNDGIADSVEGTGDADGDGIANYQDEDSDGNGILDSEEGSADTDGDGVMDFLDEDNDDNGYNDEEDGTGDADGDGTLDYQDSDMDNDGTDDVDDSDIDGDGVPNSEENNPDLPEDYVFPPNGTPDDVDGDGIPNEVDTDTDGDGVTDRDEMDGNNNYDPNEDGNPEVVFNGDGTVTYNVTGSGVTPSTITKKVPSGATVTDINGNGIPNYLDNNDDNDDFTAQQEAAYNQLHNTDSSDGSSYSDPILNGEHSPIEPDMYQD